MQWSSNMHKRQGKQDQEYKAVKSGLKEDMLLNIGFLCY